MAWLIALSALIGADAYVSSFEQANAAYNARQYNEAVAQYEHLVASGVHDPAVFLNLGNAYFRMQRYGAAIANYERALNLSPRLDAAQTNLALALKQTKHNLAKPLPPAWEQAVLFWHYRWTYGGVRGAALFTWLLFWGLAALRLWRPLPYLRLAAGLVFAAAVAFAVSAWVKSHPSPLAVAAAQTVPVRYGKSEQETVHFELCEGDRVLVDSRGDGWARIATIDGHRGWVKEDALIPVGPPYAAPPPLAAETPAPGSAPALTPPANAGAHP